MRLIRSSFCGPPALTCPMEAGERVDPGIPGRALFPIAGLPGLGPFGILAGLNGCAGPPEGFGNPGTLIGRGCGMAVVAALAGRIPSKFSRLVRPETPAE